MPFSSVSFLLYLLPVTLFIYYICFPANHLRNFVLLFASLVFYAFGQTYYFLILLGSIAFNWAIGQLIRYGKGVKKTRRGVFFFGIAINLLILVFFKQIAFVFSLVSPLVSGFVPETSPMLPLGLSFFTLQAVSYLIDIFRGKIAPDKNIVRVGLYLAFFPKIIAGPVVGYQEFSQEMLHRQHSMKKLSAGVCRFVVGLAKKVLIANVLMPVANNIFSWSAMGRFEFNVPATLALLGVVCYALQLYFELSGYADMAIGLAGMFGFNLPENFNHPFTAASMTEFWRRWQMTLLGWFREYLYPVFSKNQPANNDIVVRNLLFTWAFFGLWHGADWTWLFWVAWNYLLLLAEFFFDYPRRLGRSAVMRAYTLVAVAVGMVLMRADGIYAAGRYFMNLFGMNMNGFFSDVAWVLLRENWIVLLIAIIFSTPVARKAKEWALAKTSGASGGLLTVLYPSGVVLLFAATVVVMTQQYFLPFIYY